jgi:hypothetical protein
MKTELYDLVNTTRRFGNPERARIPAPPHILHALVLGNEYLGSLRAGTYRYAVIACAGDGARSPLRAVPAGVSIIPGQVPCIEAYSTDLDTVALELYRIEGDALVHVGTFAGREFECHDGGAPAPAAVPNGQLLDNLNLRLDEVEASLRELVGLREPVTDEAIHRLRSARHRLMIARDQAATEYRRALLAMMARHCRTDDLKFYAVGHALCRGAVYEAVLRELVARLSPGVAGPDAETRARLLHGAFVDMANRDASERDTTSCAVLAEALAGELDQVPPEMAPAAPPAVPELAPGAASGAVLCRKTVCTCRRPIDTPKPHDTPARTNTR